MSATSLAEPSRLACPGLSLFLSLSLEYDLQELRCTPAWRLRCSDRQRKAAAPQHRPLRPVARSCERHAAPRPLLALRGPLSPLKAVHVPVGAVRPQRVLTPLIRPSADNVPAVMPWMSISVLVGSEHWFQRLSGFYMQGSSSASRAFWSGVEASGSSNIGGALTLRLSHNVDSKICSGSVVRGPKSRSFQGCRLKPMRT